MPEVRGILGRPRIPFDDHGQAGPGAMILLIASVLVASIVAALVIGVVGQTNLQGARTSQDSRDRLAAPLQLESAAGTRPNGSTPLTQLDIYVSLAPEKRALDLYQVRLEAQDGAGLARLSYVDGPASNTEFNASIVRDAGSAFDAFEGILSGGDSARISVNLTATNLELSERDALEIQLIPAEGPSARARFTAPAAFGTALKFELY